LKACRLYGAIRRGRSNAHSKPWGVSSDCNVIQRINRFDGCL
jgi:hypothetical protein